MTMDTVSVFLGKQLINWIYAIKPASIADLLSHRKGCWGAACCKPDPTPNSATAIGKIQGLQTSRNCSKYADLSKRCGYQIARRITLLSNFDGNHKRL